MPSSPYFSWCHVAGILGGKPRAAHYFVGVTATQRLLYLDPHSVQPALHCETADAAADAATCHLGASASLPSMPLLDLDPSLAVGLLLTSLVCAISPHLAKYLPVSPRISPHLPWPESSQLSRARPSCPI